MELRKSPNTIKDVLTQVHYLRIVDWGRLQTWERKQQLRRENLLGRPRSITATPSSAKQPSTCRYILSWQLQWTSWSIYSGCYFFCCRLIIALSANRDCCNRARADLKSQMSKLLDFQQHNHISWQNWDRAMTSWHGSGKNGGKCGTRKLASLHGKVHDLKLQLKNFWTF